MNLLKAIAIAALAIATPSLAGQKAKFNQTPITMNMLGSSNAQIAVRHAKLRLRAFVPPPPANVSTY